MNQQSNDTMTYTITSTDENNYGVIRCNLAKPRNHVCNFSITALTTKCAIVVLESYDWIKINDTIYYIKNDYTELNALTLCDVINNVIVDSSVSLTTDYCLRIVFESENDFVINDASYNVKQLTGLFNAIFPIPSTDKKITAQTIGNYLSTPILYLVSNVGPSCYSTDEQKYNGYRTLMRINNSFSNNFPIIASNGEFSVYIRSNDLSDITIKLVDSNHHDIHLLSPMYLSAVAVGIELQTTSILLSEPSEPNE